MSELESKIQHRIIDYLQSKGHIVLKTIRLNHSGFPDIIVLKEGKISFIEVKSETGRLSALQVLRIRQLQDENFKCYIFRNLEECKSVFP